MDEIYGVYTNRRIRMKVYEQQLKLEGEKKTKREEEDKEKGGGCEKSEQERV